MSSDIISHAAKKPGLIPDEIPIAEFEYAGQGEYQVERFKDKTFESAFLWRGPHPAQI